MAEYNDKELNNDDETKSEKILDYIYGKALSGIPQVSKPVDEMVADYLNKNSSPLEAARSLKHYQIAKCATSGFITGFGGFLTLPVTIPANLSSVLYVQMRMVAAIAKIGGYDLNSDQIQTMVYVCLTGNAAGEIVKKTAVQVGEKTLTSAIKKIPGKALTKINQAVGYRLMTKAGSTGAINLSKGIPAVGAFVGAGIDSLSTKIIADNAIRIFIENDDYNQIISEIDESAVCEEESPTI